MSNFNYPISIIGFGYSNEYKRTYSHNDGLPESLGLLLKKQLTKYKDIKKLRNKFKDIIMIDPYTDKLSLSTIEKMINKKYINYDELLNNAHKLNIDINSNNIEDIKTNWFNVLNQWTFLGIKPYVEYDTPYMIDYDSLYRDIDSPVNFEYMIDLDSKDLIISGMSDTAISFEELYEISDDEFLDMIYYNENNIIFKDEPF